jgi:polysaccharide export outer membrane protein
MRHLRHAVPFIALLILPALGTAPALAQTPAAQPPTTQPAAAVPPAKAPVGDDYRIGPEDALSIIVWKNEALSRAVTVRPDGKISLPLLNDVQAAGLTSMQLRDDLTKKFTEFMPSPEVSVLITDVRSFKVSVLGQINRPGRYDLRSKTTMLDIIALAGGFRDFAAPTRIVILRQEGKTTKRIPFNYNRVIQQGGEAENFDLQPNDIILVP